MASVLLRLRPLGVARGLRAFSSTAKLGAAAEVKKLGVVGAGQMVGRPSTESFTLLGN